MKKDRSTHRRVLFSSLLPVLAGFLSCSLLFGPSGGSPEVSDCYPEGMLSPAEPVDIAFSAPMDRSSVERFFTFTGPGGRMEGTFTWKNRREVSFLPQGVEPPEEYILSIDGAESTEGIPMDAPFRRIFPTLPDSAALQLLSWVPGPHTLDAAPDTRIRMEFSSPVDRESFYKAFSLEPEVPGEYVWRGNDTEIEYIPRENLYYDTEYTIRLSPECTDYRGAALEEPFSTGFSGSFSTAQRSSPHLAGIKIASEGSTRQPDPQQLYTVEKEETLRLYFSEPVEEERREGLFGLSPEISFSVEWSSKGEEADIVFTEPLSWEEVYILSIFEKTYMFVCRGENSLPVQVEEVYFCNRVDAPEPEFISLEQNCLLTPEDSATAALDIRFSHAAEGELIKTSLLEAVSLRATNGSAALTLKALELDPDSPASPAPEDPPVEGTCTAVRLLFSIQMGSSSGRLLLDLQDSVKDSLGNTLVEDFFMGLNL